MAKTAIHTRRRGRNRGSELPRFARCAVGSDALDGERGTVERGVSPGLKRDEG